MDKQQLIQYLDTVYDAEIAIDACRSSIQTLEEQLSNCQFPSAPEEPHLQLKKRSSLLDREIFFWYIGFLLKWFAGSFIVSIVAIAILLEVFNISGGATTEENVIRISAIIAAVVTVCILLLGIREVVGDRKKVALQNKETDKANEVKQKEYQSDLILHKEQCNFIEVEKAALSEHITHQEQLLGHLLTQRSLLYDLNYIDENFRKLVPVYQIRFYLKTGICDKLEGPDGAYAQYMQDVRTEQICASIEDLKEAMLYSFSQLQSALVKELREIDFRLTRLNRSLNTSLQGISANITQYNHDTSLYLAHANQQLTAIKNNSELIAVNQYISQRSQGIDAYYYSTLIP